MTGTSQCQDRGRRTIGCCARGRSQPIAAGTSLKMAHRTTHPKQRVKRRRVPSTTPVDHDGSTGRLRVPLVEIVYRSRVKLVCPSKCTYSYRFCDKAAIAIDVTMVTRGRYGQTRSGERCWTAEGDRSDADRIGTA